MKVKIDKDEWYPVFYPNDYGTEVDLTDDEVEMVESAIAAFDQVQIFLREKFEAAGGY